MRYQTPLVVVMAVALAAMLGVTTISATNLIVQNSPATENFGMMVGHVELILRDMDGNIKTYSQGDNLITDSGDRCASERLFEANSGDGATENCGNAEITVIGLGNETAVTSDDNTDIELFDVAGNGDAQPRIMATIGETVVTVGDGAGAGVATTITNSAHLFTFTDGSGNANQNNTTILNVLLMDAECTIDSGVNGQCGTIVADLEIFASRDATLAVSDGDTLQVTWTITVGGAN